MSDDIWPDDFIPMGKPLSTEEMVMLTKDKWDAMQATIATLREQVVMLTTKLDFQDTELVEQQKYILQLEREVSRLQRQVEWEPLPDGIVTDGLKMMLAVNDLYDRYGDCRVCRRKPQGEGE